MLGQARRKGTKLKHRGLSWQLSLHIAPAALASLAMLLASPASAEDASAPATENPEAIMAPVGSIGWVEFAADREKGNAFFSKVFGWTFEPFMDGYDTYAPAAGVGGGYRNAGEGDIPVLPFIIVADIDAKIAELTTAGSTVLLAKEAVGEGSIAVLTDATGNPLGLTDLTMPMDYLPDPFGDPAQLVPNAFCGIEIYGGDLAQARDFYSTHFGWTIEEPDGDYAGFDPPGGVGGVFQSHSPDASYVMYIWVDDVDPVLEAVAANGGTVAGDPGRAEGMPVFAYFLDPGGIMFGLMAPEGT